MGLLKRVVSEFFKDDAMTHAAALAYYGALSLAPLVLILLWIASFVGPTAEKTLVDQAVTAMGEQAGSSIQQVIGGARARPTLANISGAVGLGVLLFSAASVFVQLQHALNRIWDVKPRPDAGIWNTVRKRLLSFAVVLLMGLLLMASLVLGFVLSAGLKAFGESATLLRLLNEAVIFVVLTAFLALVFKYLPDVKISWRDVWLGAAVTAVLLSVGKLLIGLYLGRSGVASGYGAAGSIVLLLVWAYYSGIILLFGAEFTQVWAGRSGRRIVPDEHAQSAQADAGAPQVAAAERPARPTPAAPAPEPVRATASSKEPERESRAVPAPEPVRATAQQAGLPARRTAARAGPEFEWPKVDYELIRRLLVGIVVPLVIAGLARFIGGSGDPERRYPGQK